MKVEYKGKTIDPFKVYADIKAELNRLEEERKDIEMLLIETLDGDGLKDKITSYGHFYSMGRKTWEYSEAIKEKTEELKEQKKTEELAGIAKIKKVSSYIMLDIKQIKNE